MGYIGRTSIPLITDNLSDYEIFYDIVGWLYRDIMEWLHRQEFQPFRGTQLLNEDREIEDEIGAGIIWRHPSRWRDVGEDKAEYCRHHGEAGDPVALSYSNR